MKNRNKNVKSGGDKSIGKIEAVPQVQQGPELERFSETVADIKTLLKSSISAAEIILQEKTIRVAEEKVIRSVVIDARDRFAKKA